MSRYYKDRDFPEIKRENPGDTPTIFSVSSETRDILPLIDELNAKDAEIADLRDKLAKAREALTRIKAHGCCIMHNDESCPGCIAHKALVEITGGERNGKV